MDPSCVLNASLAAARQAAKPFAEAQMTSMIKISRPNEEAAFNYDTGALSEGPDLVYEGKARVERVTGGTQLQLGEEVQFFSTTSVEIPLGSADPRIDDLIEVTAAPDPAIIGRLFRITDVEGGGDIPVSLRMNAVGVQRSSQQEYV